MVSWLSNRSAVLALTLQAGVLCVTASGEQSFAPSSGDVQAKAAASVIGNSTDAVLELVREVRDWRSRALKAESANAQSRDLVVATGRSERSEVVATLESERVVILSSGKTSGFHEGTIVTLGDKVAAKVVESRSAVCAAVVENSYQGKLAALEGLLAKLSAR